MTVRRRIKARIRTELRQLVRDEPAKVPTTTVEHVTRGRGTYWDTAPIVHYYGEPVAVRIGNYCSIARNVEFLLGGNHHTDWVTTFPVRWALGVPGAFTDGHPWTKGDIVVGHDVWLGLGCKIMNGVRIGNGAVVAAYSVVIEDVSPFAIVAGTPAIVKRYRFDDATIAALQRIAWWDWPEGVVADRAAELCTTDLAGFIAAYG